MSGSDYMGLVASLGCILARLGFEAECSGRIEVHHIRHGQGMTDRASDYLVLPACTAHHTGKLGVHYPKSLYTRTGFSELDLLAKTIELVMARRI